MKVSLLFAVIAIAASSIPYANADDRRPSHLAVAAAAVPGCTGGVWPAFAACRNVFNFKNYSECSADAVKRGWRGNNIWWYCSSLGLKD